METSYDVIVLGSGLKETLLAYLLAAAGKSVLVLDRNNFYGGDASTFSLRQIYQMSHPDQTPPAWVLSRSWNVDMVPKLLRGNSELAVVLRNTVGRYLEWQWVDVVSTHQLPSASLEATGQLKDAWDAQPCCDLFALRDLPDAPFSTLVGHLDPVLVDFLGHAVGQFEDDSFLVRPCSEVLTRIREFGARPYSNFLYPLYGVSCYSEAFSRLGAINGSVMMLSRSVDSLLFNANGRVRGIQSLGEAMNCTTIVCDPSYVLHVDKARCIRTIVRAVCVLDHPVACVGSSGYIVIPQTAVGRKHDLYVTVLSAAQCVCPQGYFLATISTVVETADPASELTPALHFLGATLEVFTKVFNYCEANNDEKADGVFVLSSLDETGHLERVLEEVKWVYEGIVGRPLSIEATGS